MSWLKNILFVSYLKNKGIRRICFVVGLLILLYNAWAIGSNILANPNIDETYKNLYDINQRLYFDYKYKVPFWYKRVDCFGKYLNKYGLASDTSYAFTSYEDVINSAIWCDFYVKECKILKAIKDEPITLKCSKFESPNFSILATFTHIFIFLILCFYFPFIILCIIKLLKNLFIKIYKWIYAGFKEK